MARHTNSLLCGCGLIVFIDLISIVFSIVLYPTIHMRKQYLILYLSV